MVIVDVDEVPTTRSFSNRPTMRTTGGRFEKCRSWRGRRKNRRNILAFVCVISAVLLTSVVLVVRGLQDIAQGYELAERLQERYLRQEGADGPEQSEWPNSNCSHDHEEFLFDLFSMEELRHGAVIIHFLVTAYMFAALAIVCDVYFMPAIEIGCDVLNLSEDVAGATLMAMGGSAPELFSSIIAVFIVKNDIGLGTIVGSAVFNIQCVIGLCGVLAGQVIILSCWPLMRDSICYIISVVALYTVLQDGTVDWKDSICLLALYILYCILMYNNPKIEKVIAKLCCCVPAPSYATSSTTSSSTVDRGGRASSSEMKNAIEVTPLISDTESLSNEAVRPSTSSSRSRHLHSASSNATVHINYNRNFVDKGVQVNILENGIPGNKQSTHESDCENHNDPRNKEPEADSHDDDGSESPFALPKGHCARFAKILSYPIIAAFYVTIPNCQKKRWERCFVMTFIVSLLWIALLTYVLVWMVSVIGETLEIPSAIMGLTLLAAGASMPDTILSVIAARAGCGDMAISHSIGSNIFDILLGLGIPWFLQTAVIDRGSVVPIYSKSMVYIIILLICSVIVAVSLVVICRFHLGKVLGVILVLMYIFFIVMSILLDMGVLIPDLSFTPCVNGIA